MMLPLAASASTVSSLATGVGTLVLAVATFASVRSSQRSARVAEEALLEQRRPVLSQSRFDDPAQKIMFVERNWVHAGGGRGAAEYVEGRIYLVLSLRNVGSGIGVCQAWAVTAQQRGARQDHLPDSEFRPQTRDLYIAAGDLGMWQGALRDPEEPGYAAVRNAIETLQPLQVELLYSDQVGEQRTITRFALAPYADTRTNEVSWTASVLRHWFLDRQGPRSERDIEARAEQIMRRITDNPEAAATAEVASDGGDSTAEGDAGDGAALVEADGISPETDRRGLPQTGPGEAESSEDGSLAEQDGDEPVSVIPRPNCE